MNTNIIPDPVPIPGVGLSRRDVAAVARLRAEGTPWPDIVEKLEILPEYHRDIDLLPLFHPDWAEALAEGTRLAEDALFAEAQLVTRRQLRYAVEPKVRRAATKRAGRHRPRGGSRTKTPPLNPDGALVFRLARGETVEDIKQRYLAEIRAGTINPDAANPNEAE